MGGLLGAAVCLVGFLFSFSSMPLPPSVTAAFSLVLDVVALAFATFAGCGNIMTITHWWLCGRAFYVLVLLLLFQRDKGRKNKSIHLAFSCRSNKFKHGYAMVLQKNEDRTQNVAILDLAWLVIACVGKAGGLWLSCYCPKHCRNLRNTEK